MQLLLEGEISDEGTERAVQGGSLVNHVCCELVHHQRLWLRAIELAMQPAVLSVPLIRLFL